MNEPYFDWELGMEFFSNQLVSSEFVDRLAADVKDASVLRFLVAYVNDGGIDAIGRHSLLKALRNVNSFGVASLSCSCGFTPLLRLQRELGHRDAKLKYFMDPMVKDGEGDETDLSVSLLHSKLVYLQRRDTNTSIIYVGSHNWTRRALGSHLPRNAEASFRFEMPFEPSHLTGEGTTLVHRVTEHLRSAFDMDACFSATSENEGRFQTWYELGCKKSLPSRFDVWTVILAVRTMPTAPIDPQDWLSLRGAGIYLQCLDPEDGERIRQANKKLLLLVWQSMDDFRESRQPIVLRCHDSAQNPGPLSRISNSNQSPSPIEGFSSVLFDHKYASTYDQMLGEPEHSRERTSSGRSFYHYDLEFPTSRRTALEVDAGIRVADQFLLEVDDIVFPADSRQLAHRASKVWTAASLAFSKPDGSAKLEKPPGYLVSEEREQGILRCFREEFGVESDKIKIKPVSRFDNARIGLRISAFAARHLHTRHSRSRR